jgi:hypothetical protein
MTTGQKLFDPTLRAEGETDDQVKSRIERNKQIFRNALDTSSGREFLKLIATVSPPIGPRFTGNFNAIEAAINDGEKNFIALMVMNGTDEVI